MCSIGATLTLPGIAGIVLTIGMAVDANVLILRAHPGGIGRKGKSLRGAIAAGYERAFSTIFDSHVTTLISSDHPDLHGHGPHQGLRRHADHRCGGQACLRRWFVTRLDLRCRSWTEGWLKALPMLHLIRSARIDFMRGAKYAFVGSWTLIVDWRAATASYRGGNVLGVDFAGGDSLTLELRTAGGR